MLEKVKSFSMPTVLTGDFNFHENDPLFALPSQAGLRYARTTAKNSMNGPTYHNYRPENYYYSTPMDHIWVNSGVRSVETYRIVTDKLHGSFVSDHYPVYTDIIL